MGRDSSVGIATRYGLDGTEIESQSKGGGGEFSALVQTVVGVKRPGPRLKKEYELYKVVQI